MVIQSDIASLFRAEMSKSEQPNFKNNQILRGKIEQIFPNQTAKILIGDHHVIAKLNTPLDVGGYYLFQVEDNRDLPHLKVIEHNNVNANADPATALLKKFDLPLTKENQKLLHSLLDSKVPFRSKDIKASIQLAKFQGASEETIVNMLRRQLPLTETTLKAISSENKHALKPQLAELVRLIDQLEVKTVTDNKLLTRINTLLPDQVDQQSVLPSSLDHVQVKDDEVIQLLRQAGIISKETTVSNEQLVQQFNSKDQSFTFVDKLAQLFQKQLPMPRQNIVHLKKMTIDALSDRSGDNSTHQVRADLQKTLRHDVTMAKKIEERLPESVKLSFNQYVSGMEPKELQLVLYELNELLEQQISKANQTKLITLLSQAGTRLPMSERFIIHMKQFLNFSGLNYEYKLANEDLGRLEQDQSLKQTILEAIQPASNSSYQNHLDTLLDTINGLQLTSVQEQGAFLQVQLQLPALLGTNDNISLQFNSKKEKGGQLDSNFCRVAFILNLDAIGETMIDMAIQNRLVHLTIHNNESIEPLLQSIKPLLNAGLKKNDYYLSSVNLKPYRSNNFSEEKNTWSYGHNFTDGVDMRV